MEETHNFLIFFSYLGANFNGSAYQKNNENTVENILVEKLKELKFISCYNDSISRVSRTDKGVSARINALTIRLNNLYPHFPLEKVQKRYVKDLNNKLTNVHILDIQKVPNAFDARLYCIHRTYIYFFVNKNYNLKEMKEAAKVFVGEHNFFNFSRKGRNKTSYMRTVLKFDVMQIDKNFYYFKIKGVSFLYNQIRHMVASLFLVGKGLMSKNDIILLLKNTDNKTKCYAMAKADGLILHSFKFSDLDFKIPLKTGEKSVFHRFMNQYIQRTIILVTLCYPLKLKNKSDDLFDNLSD